MKSLILASSNPHKAEEFKELFVGTLSVHPAPASLEVDESGKTFTENALLKAKAYFDTYKTPAVADDSGLVLEALPELLGVESARFAPHLKDYSEKCREILKIYQDRGIQDRSAYFVCVLCFYFSSEEIYFFEGRVHGKIAQEARGEGGFGYDPIFIPERKEEDGLSLAELPEWKNEFSHRAKASQAAVMFLKKA